MIFALSIVPLLLDECLTEEYHDPHRNESAILRHKQQSAEPKGRYGKMRTVWPWGRQTAQ
jgi:hypothetical protein